MLKPLTFLLCLVPFGYTVVQIWLLQTGASHNLGADPGRELVLIQGSWAIRFLILTLMVSPLRRLTGWVRLTGIRRMLGLYTFFYASLHLLSWAFLLLELDPGRLGEELAERPYISVGFLGWLLLVPLAVTSNAAMVRYLGRRWRHLHAVVYGIAVLAGLHVFWMVKSSYLEATIYGGLLGILLVTRFFLGRFRIFQTALSTRV